MDYEKKLTVISLVGPSAAGKSTALKALKRKYSVLEEKYMELNVHEIDNTLVLSKWGYLNYWFDGILLAKKNGDEIIVTDRCPYDTCAYVKNGTNSLLDTISISIKELENHGIVVKTLLVTAEFDILQERIVKRLSSDLRRLKYHEDNEEHNRLAFNFFEKNHKFWNERIDTSAISITNLFHEIDLKIKKLLY